MKVSLPQVYWHGNSERIMALDFRPRGMLLATCGADLESQTWIRIWELKLEGDNVVPMHMDDLAGTHERTVNVVRFSPNGRWLASGGDDGCVVLWELRMKQVFGENREVEGWAPYRILRGHSAEIHDLCWSGDSQRLATASMDKSCIVFHAEKAKVQQRLEGHKHYVQGVTWHKHLIATQSCDRTVRIYKQGDTGFFCKHVITSFQDQKLFQDPSASSAFFRRLSFSPDGALLVTPAGLYGEVSLTHCFFKKNLNVPICSFPVADQVRSCAIAVRFCPVLFASSSTSEFLSKLPHKLVWAVATRESVHIYTSEQLTPVASFQHFHYDSLSDVAWQGASMLAISSLDGYVSFVILPEGQFGEPLPVEEEEVESVEQTDSAAAEAQAPTAEVPRNDGKRRIQPVMVA